MQSHHEVDHIFLEIGMITIDRVGTLRPQFLPPYAPDSFGFVESVQDFDESQQYYQPVHNRLPSRSINQDSYEILLHLPFVPSIVIRYVISRALLEIVKDVN